MTEATSLKKCYDGRTVLDVPRLTLQAGGRYALLGENGSGKSTLLRILAGQLPPEGGKVDYRDFGPGDIGYLPQAPYAFDLTVLQNVQLPLGPGKAAEKRALEALDRLGLGALRNARGSRLSGGEAQRMALARLLTRRWRLLLLDEPAAGADIRANDRMEAALSSYWEETRCTLLFSTHAPGQALRLSRQTILLQGGRVAELGDTEQVLRQPASEAAKQFLRHWAG